MKCRLASCFLVVFLTMAWAGSATAVEVPFLEDFSTGTAGWLNTSHSALTHSTSGGPDGGSYVSTSTAFSAAAPQAPAVTLFRAEQDYHASGDAFVGDWPGDGAGLLTAYIRHHAPVPLSTFARFATEFNFPGATIEDPTLIPPDVWTPIRFDVDPANPRLTMEGPFPFSTVFGDVGNVQIGVAVPSSHTGDTTPYLYDLALVRIRVPEPTGLVVALGLGAFASLGGRRGRRNR